MKNILLLVVVITDHVKVGGGGVGMEGLSEGLLGFEGKRSTEGNSHR